MTVIIRFIVVKANNCLFQVAYTYDAGPNACLYLLEKDVPLILSLVRHFYPTEDKIETFVRGPDVQTVDLNQVTFGDLKYYNCVIVNYRYF